MEAGMCIHSRWPAATRQELSPLALACNSSAGISVKCPSCRPSRSALQLPWPFPAKWFLAKMSR